jgi:hypothetical protein
MCVCDGRHHEGSEHNRGASSPFPFPDGKVPGACLMHYPIARDSVDGPIELLFPSAIRTVRSSQPFGAVPPPSSLVPPGRRAQVERNGTHRGPGKKKRNQRQIMPNRYPVNKFE